MCFWRPLTPLHLHAKNDSANIHKSCRLKVTGQTYISLGGCTTFFDFSINVSKKMFESKMEGGKNIFLNFFVTSYTELDVAPLVFVI